jgi:hypothetical protein
VTATSLLHKGRSTAIAKIGEETRWGGVPVARRYLGRLAWRDSAFSAMPKPPFFLAAVFLAEDFLAEDFLAEDFLAEDFLADFFAVAIVASSSK